MSIILLFLCFITLINCADNEAKCEIDKNFCAECDSENKFCKACYWPILVPNDKGGCIGTKKCTPKINFCIECDYSSNICKICEENYFPDNNGGCSTTDNCLISYEGSCIICKDEFALIQIGNISPYFICENITGEQLNHCKDFNKYGRCNECEKDFYINSGDSKCSSSPNCSISYEGICVKCKSTYYLDKSDNNLCKSYATDVNFLYCSESEDGEECSICTYGYYLTEDKKCVLTNFCKNAKKMGYYCSKCSDGYYLTNDERTCVDVKNCESGHDKEGKCFKCVEGFYFDTLEENCKSNQKDNKFKYCYKGSEKCEECLKQYSLGEDGKCTRSENCYESENGICIKCKEGFILGKLDNKCTNIEKCIKSDYYYTCIECEDGFYYNYSQRKCLSDENIDEEKDLFSKNCKTTDPKGLFCKECKEDFYLNKSDYKCYKNDDANTEFYKCAETDIGGKICDKCIEGFFLGTLDHKCTKVFGCAVSENIQKCSECVSYLCKNLKKGNCLNTEWIEEDESNLSCFRCKITNKEGTACAECQEGYELNEKGLCIDPEGCEIESKKGAVCEKCRQNFVNSGNWFLSYCLNDEYGCMDEDIEGCYKCNDKKDFNKCTKCFDGYYLNKDGFCSKCKPGCSNCTNEYNCGGCGEGHYIIREGIDEQSFDYVCRECSEGCKECENEYICKSCYEGYFITNEKSEEGYIECTQCSKNCIECQDGDNCLTCKEGYKFIYVDDKILCKKEK